jgi:phage terminase small subunit
LRASSRIPLNAKQEAFCQAVVAGIKPRQAYIDAGYQGVNGVADASASRMLKSVKIRQRISTLRRNAVKATGITVVKLTEMLLDDRALARRRGQVGAAIAADVAIGKLHGHFVEKKQLAVIAKPGFSLDVLELTEDEWSRQFALPAPDPEKP